MKLALVIWLVVLSIPVIAQEATFKVAVSSDTILMNNVFQVRFTIENGEGEFEAPAFAEFDIISGPNVSSSMSIINGDMEKTESYSYYLKPRSPGKYYIEEGYVVDGESMMETKPLTIIVEDNPDGIQQEIGEFKEMDLFNWGAPNKAKKKKTSNVKRYKL